MQVERLTHRVDIVVFLKREDVVVPLALPETHGIRRLGTADHDLLDTELASDLDDVVRGLSVTVEKLVVGNKHVSSVRGEVDDDVGD